MSEHGGLRSFKPWDFAADDDVANAATWALDALEDWDGDVEKAEAHTNWAHPLFRNPAFTREYCKALYDPDNAADYAD